jgi:ribonuclease VapC
VVVDSSVLLAIVFKEPAGRAAQEFLDANRSDLQMSPVNYTETLILIHDRQPHLFGELKETLELSTIDLVPPTALHAEMAALARVSFPLNIGDCFAYALAKHLATPVITLDRDFLKTDLRVLMPGK